MKTRCFKNYFAAASFALTALAATGGEDLARWVDPFVGTAATGHTFPAACVPFGLVQAGPDTGHGTWDYCSGYRYGDKTICGFTQTHLNGTGCPDLGDVRILQLKTPTRNSNSNFAQKLSEVAEPGYYAVTLDGGIKVEIAAAEHSAIYRITGNEELRLLVDCAYGIGGKDFAKTITASDVRLIGKSGLSGKNHRRQWVERDYSFVVKFGRECAAVEELPKQKGVVAPQYVFDFDAGESPLLMKVALSAEGGVEAAERNLAAEIVGWDFDAVKNAARAKWNEVLSRATIEGTDDQKKNWYTSLYHLFIQPNNIADVGAKPFYSTLSTWDTFRAAHPLYTILAPEKAADFVDSMLEQGRRTGYLPIWTLWGKDNQCMIGTHSVPVIVDWFLKEVGENSWSSRKNAGESWSPELEFEKGRTNSTLQLNPPTQISNSNSKLQLNPPTPTLNSNSKLQLNPPTPTLNSNSYWLSAYAQIKDTLTKPHKGRSKERWDLLDKYGYYPFDKIKGESVSRTLECAYDDWCAGMMAEKLGFPDDAAFFRRRSENWRNVFDASIGLVRGKDSNGKWREPYDPYALGHGADKANDFTEGNAFQYTWHVMQNPQGLVDAMGGRGAFVKKLDSLFEALSKTDGMGEVLDVTGLIGQYVHGNEPSHHVIYFYPQVGLPEKAAERIREVFDKFYLPKPDGLCGNDDCGQMSAWYLFSAMGFYPFNPCGGEYVIGAPQVERVEIELERIVGVGERKDKFYSPTRTQNSNSFTIIARNLSKENKYVKSVTLNGKPITDWKIRHADIMSGGELVFEMCSGAH
ncbi:MAG: GH92 family glycosyl hydrolase [Kiritimatiellae bacterium]|nr:GH92 family glycosyl hydrolase [Kiritimatiellia bacterium]